MGVEDGGVGERDEWRDGGFGAGRDNDVVGFKLGLSARTRYLHVVRIEKAGGSRHDFDAVSGKLGADDIDLGLDDVERAKGKIGHGDLILPALVDAVNTLILIPGNMQSRFGAGLAWDRSGV